MLAGYLPFDDDPANPEGDNINLLYKYIVTTPLTFPEYVTPHARDLLRRILVPDPRKRADLFEVARHSWLSEYSHIVSHITSSTTNINDIATTTVPPGKCCILTGLVWRYRMLTLEHQKEHKKVHHSPGVPQSGSLLRVTKAARHLLVDSFTSKERFLKMNRPKRLGVMRRGELSRWNMLLLSPRRLVARHPPNIPPTRLLLRLQRQRHLPCRTVAVVLTSQHL